MDLSLVATEDGNSPAKSVASEPIVFQGVDLQVVDYYYIGDGAAYDKHYFIIEVFVEDMKYTVDRSYVDFIELDRRLRKVYPETSLPNMPLEGAESVEHALIKEASSLNDVKKVPLGSGQFSSTRNSVAYTRDSLISSPPFKPGSKRHNYQLLLIPEDSTEIIKKQKNALTLYLVGLTCHHELLTSEAMTAFLDQEYTSMFTTVVPPPLSTFDLALLKVEVNHTIVSRIEEQVFKVPANHMVVWRFSLENFDIGFTVEVNGKIRLPLTRYRASVAPVCGAIEVPNQSIISLRWNNSYARLHSKNLTWSVRVLSRTEYDTYKNQAMDCQKEKHQFQLQRDALKRAVVRHAERLSGVIHGSIIEAEHAELERSAARSLQFKLSTALTRADIQDEELQRAEMRIHELEMMKLTLEDSQSVIADSWKESTGQLEDYQHTIDQLNNELVHLDQMLNDKEREVHELREEEQVLHEEREIIKNNLDGLLFSLQQAVEACRADHLQGLDLFEQREEEYRNALLSANGGGNSKESKQENKVDRLKAMINSLLSDILNSNKILKQNLDVMKQLKSGVEQMVEQLTSVDRQMHGGYAQNVVTTYHTPALNTSLSDF